MGQNYVSWAFVGPMGDIQHFVWIGGKGTHESTSARQISPFPKYVKSLCL
jgi:hypothetical protein